MPDLLSVPLASASANAEVLVDLFVVLLAAKLGDELFKRLRQPAIIGEILAGLIIGPSVLGLVGPTEVLEVFSELGVVFLLFWVGLETRLSDMREVGRPAAAVGTLGVAIPFVVGLAGALAVGESSERSVFLAVSLVATSVGITSAVLLELGVLDSRPARTILGAAVIDDILAMLLLSVAVGLAVGGDVDVTALLVTLAISVAFIAFVGLGGTRLLARRPQLLHAPRFAESPLLPAVLLCLGLAAFAASIGLAAIIGAFLAGMVVAETLEHRPVEQEIAPLYAFFPPFFFAFIGIELDLGSLASWEAIVGLLALTAVAAITKYAGGRLGARSLGRRDAHIVALGMIPRGEVGIIVAGIGRSTGAISPELFAIIVGMSILTTLLVPPVLRGALRRQDRVPA